MAIRPFANAPHADRTAIATNWLIGVQTGNTPNAVTEMKYLTFEEFTDYIKSNYGAMWNYRGESSSAIPTDPEVNDYFVCTGNFTEGGQSFVSGHVYAYNGNTWDDVSNVLNQYAKQSTVNSLSSRVSAVEAVLPTTVKKADIVDALDSSDATKVLSAKQGKVLDDKIAAISGGVIFKGECTYAELLAIQNPEAGWEYYVTDKEAFYLYSVEDGWVKTAGTVVQTPDETDITHALSNAKTTEMFNGVEDSIEVVSTEVENVKEVLDGTTQSHTDATMANTKTITNANEILPWAILKRVGARAVAWNQLVSNGNFENTTGWNAWGGSIEGASNNTLEVNVTATNSYGVSISCNLGSPTVLGHKCLVSFRVKVSDYTKVKGSKLSRPFQQGVTFSDNNWMTFNAIAEVAYATGFEFQIGSTDGTLKAYFQVVNVFDLTAMNEASLTAAQFRSLFPASYYPYNAGEIIPLNPSAFKVVGKNKWDEEWESGSYDEYGDKVSNANKIRCVNYVPVTSGAIYYFMTGIGDVFFYDANKTNIGHQFGAGGSSYTMPAGTCYIRFAFTTAYGTTYNHDIMICLNSVTDKTYEAYKETTIDTSFTSDYKYVNENCYDYVENVLVNGVMRREEHKGIVGEVDLGTLNWSGSYTTNDISSLVKSPEVTEKPNCICSNPNYKIVSVNEATALAGSNELYMLNGTLIIKSSGVPTGTLYFELATPSTPTLHDPIPNIPCEDGTTVQAVTPQTDLVNAIDVPFTVEYKTDTKLIEQITTNKNDIAKIVSGVTTVGKATADGNGNNIVSTYATKSELTSEATARANADSNLLSAIQGNSNRISNLEEKADPTGAYKTVYYRGTNDVPTGKAKYALVESIVGKSRAWNQMVQNGNLDTSSNWDVVSCSYDNGKFKSDGTSSPWVYQRGFSLIAGHKYLISFKIKSSVATTNTRVQIWDPVLGYFYLTAYNALSANNYFTSSGIYTVASDKGGTYTLYVYQDDGIIVPANETFEFEILFRDLTLIFPEGVPSTVAECVQKCPDILKYDAYGTSIVDTTVEGVRSVGVNIWDEVWENGVLGSIGQDTPAPNNLRSKNYIPVVPFSVLYGKTPVNIKPYFYDADKNYVSTVASFSNSYFSVPANASFMRFYTTSEYPSYHNDIQICLNSYTDKTTYHHYMTDTLTLPSPVTLRSAGSVADTDELNVEVLVAGVKVSKRRQTTRVGTKNLDDIQWSYLDSYGIYQGVLVGAKFVRGTSWGTSNAPYANAGYVGSADMAEGQYQVLNDGTIWIKDSNFESVRASYYLNYALATESVTLLDPIENNTIQTEGGGTIETIQNNVYPDESPAPTIDNSMDVGYLAL